MVKVISRVITLAINLILAIFIGKRYGVAAGFYSYFLIDAVDSIWFKVHGK